MFVYWKILSLRVHPRFVKINSRDYNEIIIKTAWHDHIKNILKYWNLFNENFEYFTAYEYNTNTYLFNNLINRAIGIQLSVGSYDLSNGNNKGSGLEWL